VYVTIFTAPPGVDTLPLWILKEMARPNQASVVNVVATVVILAVADSRSIFPSGSAKLTSSAANGFPAEEIHVFIAQVNPGQQGGKLVGVSRRGNGRVNTGASPKPLEGHTRRFNTVFFATESTRSRILRLSSVR
jgi:hypothetical protein